MYCCLVNECYDENIILLMLYEIDIEAMMSFDSASSLKNDNWRLLVENV